MSPAEASVAPFVFGEWKSHPSSVQKHSTGDLNYAFLANLCFWAFSLRERGILHFILLPQYAVIYNRSYLINVKGRIATDIQAARAHEKHLVSCGMIPALRAVG